MAHGRRQEKAPATRRRAERLEARVTAEQKALIAHAAALEGRSITDFVWASVRDAAKRAIKEHEMIALSVRDSQAFADAFLNPREPGARMRERVARYTALVDDGER
ncbi:type II toxin-antitoxin system TacA family antitoxin [Methylobacterium sp. JK268]